MDLSPLKTPTSARNFVLNGTNTNGLEEEEQDEEEERDNDDDTASTSSVSLNSEDAFLSPSESQTQTTVQRHDIPQTTGQVGRSIIDPSSSS